MVGASRVDFARESLTWGFSKASASDGLDTRDSARLDATHRPISANGLGNPLHIGTSVPSLPEIDRASATLCQSPLEPTAFCPSQPAFMHLAPRRNAAVAAAPARRTSSRIDAHGARAPARRPRSRDDARGTRAPLGGAAACPPPRRTHGLATPLPRNAKPETIVQNGSSLRKKLPQIG